MLRQGSRVPHRPRSVARKILQQAPPSQAVNSTSLTGRALLPVAEGIWLTELGGNTRALLHGDRQGPEDPIFCDPGMELNLESH